MEFPSQYPDSPARPLAGPSRSRLTARQARTSSLKPYNRRPSLFNPDGLQPSGSASSALSAAEPSTPLPASAADKRLAVPTAQDARSPFASLRASPIALLGSVGKAITKPLSWLTSSSSAAKSDPLDMAIPQSSSTGSLASIARKRAAARASLQNSQYDPERDAPSLSARAVGARLAAGVLGSSAQRSTDLESQTSAPSQQPPESPAVRRSARQAARNAVSPPPPPPVASSSRLSQLGDLSLNSPSRRVTRSSRRTLNLSAPEPDAATEQEREHEYSPAAVKSRSPSPARSAIMAKGRQSLYGPSALSSSASQNRGSFGYKRGSSLRPEDSIDSRMSPSASSPSFAFGYGNETRYARSSFGLPPSTSPFQLQSRSPLAPRSGRSSLGISAASDAGISPHRFRGGSLGPTSLASGSVAGVSPSGRGVTPKRRDWSSFNLAVPPSPSQGDDMMREYLATRVLPGSLSASRSAIPVFADHGGFSSRASSVLPDDAASVTPSKLGKREYDMSVDGDDDRLTPASARKRQMVWHPQYGFISQEELKAREPKPPSPKNEAERLLNVLESMRKPKTTNFAGPAASRVLAPISVPVPVSDRTSVRSSTLGRDAEVNGDRGLSASVAPYSRALRKSKLAAQTQSTADDRLTLRAKLRRSRAALQPLDLDGEEEMEDQDGEEAAPVQDGDQESQATDSEPESEPEPPKLAAKTPVRRSRRLRGRQAEEDEQEDEEMHEEAELEPKKVAPAKGKGKAKTKAADEADEEDGAPPAKATGLAKQDISSSEAAQSKPTTHRISLAAARPAAPAKKDNFSVRENVDPSAPRERSSLRQGAVKQHRSHQKSGRISAWEEDLGDDEDLPDADDLAKIKLPTNMFPSGFSFSAPSGSAPKTEAKPVEEKVPASTSSAAPATAVTPNFFSKPTEKAEEPKKDEAEKETEPVAPSGSSLLSRLGGIPAPETSSTTPQKPPPVSGFSFTAPTKENPKPTFSFNPPKPAESDKHESQSSKPSSAPSSFFSAPAEPIKPVDTEKKSGPVPNFFGSSLAKVESKEPEKPKAETSNGGFGTGAAFSFGKPATTPAFTGFVAPASDKTKEAATSGEKKDETKPAAATPSFFGGLSAAPKADESAKSASTSTSGLSSFSFGAPASAAASPQATFSFGSAPKRSADDETAQKKDDSEPAQKKAAPSFSFGTPAPAQPKEQTTTGFTGFGGFGKPSTPSTPTTEDTLKVPNFFGAAGAASTTPASKPPVPAAETKQAPTFSFGAPAATTGATKPEEQAAKPSSGFSFGAPASKPAEKTTTPAPFSFGAPASKPEDQPAKPSTAPTFSFGTPAATPKPEDKPAFTFGSPAPAAGAGASKSESQPSKPSFTFGSPAPAATTPGTAPSTFTFGAPAASSSSSSTPAPTFGGFGGAAQQPMSGGDMMEDAPNANASAPPSTFTFGSTSGSSTPFGAGAASPGPGTQSPKPFTFGAPAPAAGGAPAAPKFGASTPGFGSAAPSSTFTFGSPAPASSTPFGAAPSAAPPSFGAASGGGTSTPFTFGSPASTPQPQAQNPFSFSPAPGTGAPAAPTPGAPTPFQFSAPASPAPAPGTQTPTPPGSSAGLFNMGAAPSAANTPGGRPIKPLRQRRRG